MNEKKYKISIADTRLSVNWSGDNVGVIYSFPQSLDRYNSTHTHPMYEVFFVTSGTLTVLTPSKRIECLNSIVIIPPGLTHCTVTDKSKISVLYFKLDSHGERTETPIFEQVSARLSPDITVLPIDENREFYIKSIAEMQSDSFMSREALPHIIGLLFCDIFKSLAPIATVTASDRHRNYINAIEEYLTYNYNKKIRITDLASLLYLSPKQISRIIRKEYNCTFSELITSHRLGIARMLLVRSDLEVGAIAASVGYDYPANFFEHFKKAYGMTPIEYRKSTKK